LKRTDELSVVRFRKCAMFNPWTPEKPDNVWLFFSPNINLGQFGLWGRESLRKIGYGFSLPLIEATLDLVDENISTPAIFDGLLSVPAPLFGRLNVFQESEVVIPSKFVQVVLAQFVSAGVVRFEDFSSFVGQPVLLLAAPGFVWNGHFDKSL